MNGRIAALAGRVPELTAEQLDRMDAVALAALYSSGVRLLTVKNNDTITLHSIDSAGALTWLDTNMPRENLLVNSNFRIAQAGYGGMHGSTKYSADRWQMVASGLSVTNSSEGITFTNDAGLSYAWTLQLIDDGGFVQGKNITFFVETTDGVMVYSTPFPTTPNEFDTSPVFPNGMILRVAVSSIGISSCVIAFPQDPEASITVKYAGLLLGSYNGKTLPPRENPDNLTELLKCQLRFFVPCNGGEWFPLELTSGGVIMHFPVRMAKAPALVESKYGPMQVYVDEQWKDMKMDGFRVDFAQNSVGIRASAGSVFPDGVSVSRGPYLVRYPPSFVCDL